MKPLRLALLAGGWSGEREVSLNSGEQCGTALRSAGHEVVLIDPKTELARLVQEAETFDAVIPLLHGRFGEDGRLQGFLDCLGTPYPGTGVARSVVSMDKIMAKEVYRRAGLKVARDLVIGLAEEFRPEAVLAELGSPVVVKPSVEGSSLGMSVVDRPEDLPGAVDLARSFGEPALIEECFDGTELTCGVLDLPGQGLQPLPLIEIRPLSGRFFDYERKYTPGATEEICPAPISPELTAAAHQTGLIAHRALGLKHWSRTDLFLVEGELYVLETNTIPGMAATSLFPQAAAEAGYDLARLLERLAELAVRDRGRG